jgi:Putative peptidoglycan binding domain
MEPGEESRCVSGVLFRRIWEESAAHPSHCSAPALSPSHRCVVCYTPRRARTGGNYTTVNPEDSSAPSHAPYTRYGTPRRQGGRASSRALVITLVAIAAVVAVLVVLVGADYALSRGKIHRGVSVYGIELGGLTARQATAKLATAAPDDARLVLTHRDKSWIIATTAVGARLDGKTAARAAYGYTRRSGLVLDTWRRLSLWFSAADLEPAVVFDREKLRTELDKIAAAVEVKPVAATVRIRKGQPVVKASREGLGGG